MAIQFLHPEFLYALSLLAVPIVLHLFSLKRYKKVYFSNFTFLEALQQQKKNSSRIKKWLLLLLRLLAIACIVIAFATPYTARREQSDATPAAPRQQIVIYADNSFSMTNTGAQGILFEEAKKHLLDIVTSYPAGTPFRLLSNDAPDRLTLTREQMYDALASLKISPAAKPLSRILKEARELTEGKPATLFLLSDFQTFNCDFPAVTPDTTLETVFLAITPENRNNIYIRDIRFDRAFHRQNQYDRLHITLADDAGQEHPRLPVTLAFNGHKKSTVTADLPAGGSCKVEINYLNADEGMYRGSVKIPDVPVIFDNTFYFTYSIASRAEILYLWQSAPNPHFGKLFADTADFGFTAMPLAQSAGIVPSHYSLIILDAPTALSSGLESLLEEYLINGGNLLILPDDLRTEAPERLLAKLQAPRLTAADTNTDIARIETRAALFRDAFAEDAGRQTVLPHIRRFRHLTLAPSSEPLLSDKRGNTLLAAHPFGKGILYLSAFNFAPENSDITYHPLFVPLMANMACRLNTSLNTSYTLGSDKPVIIDNRHYRERLPVTVRHEDRSFEFIPEIRKDFSGDLILTNPGRIRKAGIYEVIQDGRVIDLLAWNIPREESRLLYCNEEQLRGAFPHARVENIRTTRFDRNSDLIKEIVHQDTNRYLTFWFILAALLILLAEQWVWRKKLN